MTKISVVVSIYNIENYLRECIDSILNQSYPNFELLLIDDGSTDNSALVCNDYAEKDNRIRVIHQRNQGLSCARNAGIKNSKSEYIYFVDGDDYLHEDTLSSFIKIVGLSGNVDFIIGRMAFFHDGEYDVKSDRWCVKPELVRDCSGQEAFVNIVKKYQLLRMGVRGLYKRKFLFENDLYFKPGMLSQDQEWTVRVFLKANTVASNNNPYYFYRSNRPGSIMNTPKLKRAIDRINIYKSWIEIVNKNRDNDSFSEILLYMAGNRYGYMIWDMCGTLALQNMNQFIEEIDKTKKILTHSNKSKYLLMYRLMNIIGTKYTIKFYRMVYTIMKK